MFDIYKILGNLEIKYKKYSHPAVFTCEEADQYCSQIPGAHVKNLFLRNKKGNQHYLIVILQEKRANLKEIQEFLNETKLSFASADRLKQFLGLTPGSVSPLGLINDQENQVKVLIDEDIIDYEQICIHPNTNEASVLLSINDFKKFLKWSNNDFNFIKII